MIRNYISVAVRNLNKNKFYSGLNIIGLSTGIACTIVILSYVRYEFSYDRINVNYDNMIRITETIKDDAGKPVQSASTPAPVAKSLAGSVNGLERIVRLYPYEAFMGEDNTIKYLEKKFVFADSSVADLFTFEVLYGGINELNKPFNMVITESIARKYFSETDVVGRILTYEDESSHQDFNVVAVIKDLPENVHFEFDIIASFVSLEIMMPWYDSWYWPKMYTYALIQTGLPLKTIEEDINLRMQTSLPDWEKDRIYDVQQLEDIHLGSNLNDEWKANNRLEYVVIFGIIAIFILSIACINYINLATSRSIQRAKEVGIRKVLGASKGRLIYQYLGESFITTLWSFLIAFGLTEWVLLVVFNKMVGVQLSLSYLMLWPNWSYLIIGVGIVALLSGLYPAFVLSGFQPAWILKSRGGSASGNSRLRKGLVIFQFAISGFLIAGTLVVFKQVNFIQKKSLGFDKNLILAFKLNNDEDQINVSKLKQQLVAQSYVVGATVSSNLPGGGSPYDNPVMPENSVREEGYNLYTMPVDHDFVDIYNLKIVEGRKFSRENIADETSSVLVNQAAIKRFGWPQDDALGRKVRLTWYSDKAEIRDAKVIGIVEDFHFNSLHHQIEPVVIYLNDHLYYTEYVSVKFGSGDIREALSIMNKEWSKYSSRPADIYFLSDELEKLYLSENRASRILIAFTLLAIIISSLGLFGLSAYSAQTRTKEIGIRKVMGASISTIVSMLAKDYMILIALANLIALPLVWYFGNSWLQNFAYRAPLGIIIFVSAFLLSIFIAFITISFQSIKAARTNPANTLKDE